MTAGALRAERVQVVYGEGTPVSCVALDGVDLEIPGGTVAVLRGPSGSGKSTLLSVLGGMRRPTEGRVWLGERLISGMPERFRTAARRALFGFVFQRFHLLRGRTSAENVAVPALPLGRAPGELEGRARELLRLVELEERADFPVEQLSGGEAQRVALARALMNDPAVLIADEPTANLAPDQARRVLDMLAARTAEGRTVLISSHDPEVWTHPAVEQVLELRGGKVVAEGPS